MVHAIRRLVNAKSVGEPGVQETQAKLMFQFKALQAERANVAEEFQKPSARDSLLLRGGWSFVLSRC